jgi:hypothetical protein
MERVTPVIVGWFADRTWRKTSGISVYFFKFSNIYLIFNRDLGTHNKICRDACGLRAAGCGLRAGYPWYKASMSVPSSCVFVSISFLADLLPLHLSELLYWDCVCPSFLINVASTSQF